MLKFLFTLLIFVAINFTSLEAQGFNSSSIQNNNDNYQNNKFNNSLTSSNAFAIVVRFVHVEK